MEAGAVARAFGAFIALLAAAMAAAGVLALVAAGPQTAAGFFVSAAAGLFVGVSLWLAAMGRKPRGGAREGLLFALMAWTIGPLFAAGPFVVAEPSGGLLAAYADAVSAVTTTGFTPSFVMGADTEPALVWWWLTLQWAGGLGTIVTALLVLAALNLTGPGVHRSVLFTLEPERLFDRLVPVTRAAGALYVAATGLAAFLALAGGASLGDALATALASVATGGLILPDGRIGAATLPDGALVAAAFGLAFGAFNFALHWDVVRGRARRGWYFADGESRAIVALAAFALIMIVLAGGASWGYAGHAAFEAVSLAATAVWDAEPGGAAALAAPVVLGVVLVGGSPISTAGGLKALRFALLIRHAGAELRRLAHPSSVGEVTYRGRPLAARQVMGLLIYAAAYGAAIGLIAIALAAANTPFVEAFAGAVAAVSNAGPAFELASGADSRTLMGSDAARAALCAGMVLGRLEILAALAVFTPGFWRD